MQQIPTALDGIFTNDHCLFGYLYTTQTTVPIRGVKIPFIGLALTMRGNFVDFWLTL